MTAAHPRSDIRADGLPIGAIAASFTDVGPDAPRFLAARAARGDHRGLSTLVSWWLSRGELVSPPLLAELTAHRSRIGCYGDVLAGLRIAVPRLTPVKGFSIADWYPAGLEREMADLDLLVPNVAAVWDAGAALLADGWKPQTTSLRRVGGRPQVHLVMKRPAAHPDLTARDRVELTTLAYEGDRVSIAPRERTWSTAPSVADCVLWLLEELRDRPVRMRDVFDLAVLYAHRDTVDLSTLAESIEIYRMRTPARALVVAASTGAPHAAAWLRSVVRSAARRRAQPWWLRRSPLSTAMSVLGEQRRIGRPVFGALAGAGLVAGQRRWGVDQLYADGTLLFGMSLPGMPNTPRIQADDPWGGARIVTGPAGAGLLHTPVGSFLLTASDQVEQTWVDFATEH